MVYPVKRELKKEENDAEELKPPIRVFVDPAEVPGREVNQEDEDPLAPDGEFFCCKIEGSAGGEYDIEGTVNDSKTRPGSAVEANSDCRKGDDLALGSTGVKPNQRVARKKSSSKNASRFSKRNSASEDELSFCGETQNRARASTLQTPQTQDSSPFTIRSKDGTPSSSWRRGSRLASSLFRASADEGPVLLCCAQP
ncbi:Protein of unknown function [Gryllus bimaculatus]|nr:Protein of unknown function [Gryllus bimaculatus]